MVHFFLHGNGNLTAVAGTNFFPQASGVKMRTRVLKSSFPVKIFKVPWKQSVITNGSLFSNACDDLRNLVSFVQFKKREKHP